MWARGRAPGAGPGAGPRGPGPGGGPRGGAAGGPPGPRVAFLKFSPAAKPPRLSQRIGTTLVGMFGYRWRINSVHMYTIYPPSITKHANQSGSDPLAEAGRFGGGGKF